MIRVVFNIFKSLFSLFFRPLKRLWCRRLKTSEMDPGVPTIVTLQSTAIDMPSAHSFDGRDEADMEMEPWDAWGGGGGGGDPSSSSPMPPPPPPAHNDHSQASPYQQSALGMMQGLANQHVRGRKPSEPEPEPEPDYFQDMIPDFRKQPKILLKRKDGGPVNSSAIASRLSVMDVAPSMGSELQSWKDEQNEWNEEVNEDLSWEAEEALREKRRMERQNRTVEQQRKKQQRDSMRGTKKDSSHHLAVRIS